MMNPLRTTRLHLLTAIALLAGFAANAAAADDPPAKKKMARADIYDKKADGAEQIKAALGKARRENKRVLLQFGANWCGWCHRLHDLFKADKNIARELSYEYEVVLIDVDTVDGKQHNAATNEKYGNPVKNGLPVLVVLDADGKALTTQDTGKLEEGDHHDPEKVIEFLKEWRAKPVDAQQTLSNALTQAKANDKKVLLTFGAPWCPWCHRLEDSLHGDKVAAIMDKAFVTCKIDVDRMTGGKDIDKRYRPSAEGGLPFFVVLDSTGKSIGDSFAPAGNIGFPATPPEIEHFLMVLKKTAPSLSASDLSALEKLLKAEKK